MIPNGFEEIKKKRKLLILKDRKVKLEVFKVKFIKIYGFEEIKGEK